MHRRNWNEVVIWKGGEVEKWEGAVRMLYSGGGIIW